MTDLTRNISSKIKYLMENFPVVMIIGARQTGKTTLVKQLAPSWKMIDMENPDEFARVSHDPMFFFTQYPQQVIFDEAQLYLDLFKALRVVVDERRQEKGRFILTGSSSPELLTNVSESLAGRVAIVELGTLKANEYYKKPLSPFYNLFMQKLHHEHMISGDAPLSNLQMQKIWLRGGYPEPILNQDNNFFNIWMQQYRNTYINRDIARLFPQLNKIAYQRFLMILSKLSGTIINRSDIARTLEISEKSARDYLRIAEGTFLWREVLSFGKNIVKSVIKMPKGYIRDSGLLHFNLRIETLDELYNNPILGLSFESFVIEEIIKGLQALTISHWDFSYYRTRKGSEIDLILDGSFGMLPIEIKYGAHINFKQLKSLTEFVKEYKLPYGMIINQSQSVEWLTPEIIQIPVGWL